jgi:hypothetical protein
MMHWILYRAICLQLQANCAEKGRESVISGPGPVPASVQLAGVFSFMISMRASALFQFVAFEKEPRENL